MGDFPFFPEQASTVAGQVDLLAITLVGLSGFFSSIVLILIIYFSIRYYRGVKADRSNPPTTSMKIELSWIFGLLFLGMGVYMAAALIFFNMSRVPEDAMEIYVLGRQWMWQIQHPEGPREVNELHVPVGQPVRLIMTSQDVIHSFYVPAFRLKYDVIPGRYTNLSFTATRTGEYHLFCAEYCGTEHSGMIGRVVVMEPRDFQNWLEQQQSQQTSREPSRPMAESGEEIFNRLGCNSCHQPGSTARAPVLEDRFGDTVLLNDGTTVVFEENYIRESILLPQQKITAGYDPIMPTYQNQITEEEIQQIIVFLKSTGQARGTDEDGSPTGYLLEERNIP
jgi:cytochrome c oxidase subunit II